jgi:hypothetical protein
MCVAGGRLNQASVCRGFWFDVQMPIRALREQLRIDHLVGQSFLSQPSDRSGAGLGRLLMACPRFPVFNPHIADVRGCR